MCHRFDSYTAHQILNPHLTPQNLRPTISNTKGIILSNLMQRLSVTLPDPVVLQLARKVAKGERSHFVANAIVMALEQEKRRSAFERLKQFTPFTVRKNSTEVLRKIRESL